VEKKQAALFINTFTPGIIYGKTHAKKLN